MVEQPMNESNVSPIEDRNYWRDERRQERRQSDHRGGIVWPVILIGAGVIFLLNNLGKLDWNIWFTLARLWPVILIAVGLEILIGRRSMLGSLVVALLVLGVMAAAVFLWRPQPVSTAGLTTQTISQGLDGATRASVHIAVGTANLTVKEGSESGGLVQGTIALGDNERLAAQPFSKSGNTAYYRLQTEQVNPARWFYAPNSGNKPWNLQLNPDVPISLQVEAGVGTATLDLSRLKISDLKANAGVGNLALTLPRSGQLSANLDAGVGRIRVVVPAGMAARIEVDRGLGGIETSGAFDRASDQLYMTRGYDSATNRVNMKINGGIGHISIEQQSGG